METAEKNLVHKNLAVSTDLMLLSLNKAQCISFKIIARLTKNYKFGRCLQIRLLLWDSYKIIAWIVVCRILFKKNSARIFTGSCFSQESCKMCISVHLDMSLFQNGESRKAPVFNSCCKIFPADTLQKWFSARGVIYIQKLFQAV